MDPILSPESDAFRKRIRAFLRDNLPPNWRGLGAIEDPEIAKSFIFEWRQTLFANGLLGVSWPSAYGGSDLSKVDQVVLVEEFAKAGVPAMGSNDNISIKMLGGSILRWGTELQKQELLPRILSGIDIWCQGFSEPNAGSDLASLTTRAVLDGDRWIIDGQKLWTSNALDANRIFVLVRTDPTAPKHRGISFLLVDMEQPGIEVRPIRSLSGDSGFNEVIFTAATTPTECILGEVNGGWSVAMSLLGLERGDEAATNPILFRCELDRLITMARDRGRLSEPLIKDRVARAYVQCEIMRFLGLRILTGVLKEGSLGPESSISKLFWSQYHQTVTALALDILGADAMVIDGRGPLRAWRADDPGSPNSTGSWLGSFWNATAGTIYAGSSQVQKTVLAESVLGLPK